jgi:hypothetical protein
MTDCERRVADAVGPAFRIERELGGGITAAETRRGRPAAARCRRLREGAAGRGPAGAGRRGRGHADEGAAAGGALEWRDGPMRGNNPSAFTADDVAAARSEYSGH